MYSKSWWAARRHLPRLIAGLLVVLLAFLGWQAQTSMRALTSHVPSVDAENSPSISRQISTDDIADAHLFGLAAAADGSPATGHPPSSWHVIGVVVSDSPQESMADIDIDGQEHVWHVGDRLPDGSTLAEIDEDGVKITGSDTVLPFELHPASLDGRFAGDANSLDAVTPLAQPGTGASLSDRMSALRTAGVAIWLQRVQQSQRPKKPPKPVHQQER